MAGPRESKLGMFGTLALVLPIIIGAVIAGMVKIPPFFANREVQRALDAAIVELEPFNDDGTIVSTINAHLDRVKASRFWVVDGQQHESLDLRLTGDEVVITRDGNRSMTIDVTYNQQMWVPLLNKVDDQTYRAHSYAKNTKS
jgi:hypothetical protein